MNTSHTEVEYLLRWGSDHRPVLMRIKSNSNKVTRSFKFDKRWIGREGFLDSIIAGWEDDPNPDRNHIHEKIKKCRKSISKWKRRNKSNSAKMIEELQKRIDEVQDDDGISNEDELMLKWQLCEAYRNEELYWKQKSRVKWLREGDRNTRFFHASTKQRRARNRIIKIRDDFNNWVETPEGIEQVATGYFHNLFTTEDPRDNDDIFRYMTESVTREMNQALTRLPSTAEIKDAVFDIRSDKAPGPDGMTSLFYQRYWKIIGSDVIKMVKHFFDSGDFDDRLNQTNICLIPKTERPSKMTEFRPISLCNVSYKIISKLLSKRLKRILPGLISETQSAFVARRLITDNILVAQEIFHALRTNPSCKSKYVAIKTDMSKAYDRVEWGFLHGLMTKMGFDSKWIGWIMKCISSVSYQVLINGEAKGHISPGRGLRQGDPLSPFLFILCTEVLISQIRGAETEHRISGIKIARASPAVSNLLFADDSLFFCKAEVGQCEELMKIINLYGEASGQQLNKAKSSVMFGSKVSISAKTDLKRALGITHEGGMSMYLGIPEDVRGSKKQVFSYILDRLNGRTNLWSAKLLSKGGKEIQLKAVAQAIPTYVMSCFLLPKDVTDKITSAMARFWWSGRNNKRGIHWVAWKKLCHPLEEGGLGFRDLREFNLALLGKQLWRIMKYPDSLLARVLKGRYFRKSSPMETGKASVPSYGWRSIMAAKELVGTGLRRTIGTGVETRVWSDNWIPTKPARPAMDNGCYRDPDLKVHHLINPETNQWNRELLHAFIAPEDIPRILSIKPSRIGRDDSVCWEYTPSGQYTVRSGYKIAAEMNLAQENIEISEPSTTSLKKHVWKIKTTRKIKHFIWQALSGCVATTSRLTDRHCGNDRVCPRCGAEEETINHVLFECPPALQCWALSNIPTSPGSFPCSSLFTNLDFLFWRTKDSGITQEPLNCFPWLIWYIWKARNEKVFNGKDVSPLDTLQLATHEAESWRFAQILEENEEDMTAIPEPTDQSTPQTDANSIPALCRCQVDASWERGADVVGLGFVVSDGRGAQVIGAEAKCNNSSPLHAEFEGLIWAMQMMINQGILAAHFETDCSQVLKLIQEDEVWPLFGAEMEEFNMLRQKFIHFTISLIPRKENSRADWLAKRSRARNAPFTYVGQLVPQWLGTSPNPFAPA